MKVFKKFIVFGISIVALLVIGTVIFVNVAPQLGAAAKGIRLERIEASENYRDGKFQNQLPTSVMAGSGSLKATLDYLKGGEGLIPKGKIPVYPFTPQSNRQHEDSLPRITWFGHSAVLVEIGTYTLFADPMLGQRASPVSFAGSKRFTDEMPIAIADLPHLDAVLISHDHYDHLDYGTIIQLKERTDHFFVPLGVGAHLERWGVDHARITELDWWEHIDDKGISLTATPARHFSGRGLMDRNKTLWCSWVIRSGQHTIFFGGDSGYGDHFKTIGDKYGPFDLTILECGQYNVNWPLIHMMPEETVQAHQDLKGRLLMPIHWGAFNLALHSWKEPAIRLTEAAQVQQVAVATPAIGQTWRIGSSIPKDTWWAAIE